MRIQAGVINGQEFVLIHQRRADLYPGTETAPRSFVWALYAGWTDDPDNFVGDFSTRKEALAALPSAKEVAA